MKIDRTENISVKINWGLIPVEVGGMAVSTTAADGIPARIHRDVESGGRIGVIRDIADRGYDAVPLTLWDGDDVVENAYEATHEWPDTTAEEDAEIEALVDRCRLYVGGN